MKAEEEGTINESPEDGAVPWAYFVEWWNTPGRVYWISGRAGCRKSTLMKFLNESKRGRPRGISHQQW